MRIVKKKLSEIVPYWRNPRINENTIEQLKKSIQEFGYRKKILIDKDSIIIAGHARYKALLQLGFEEIECLEIDLEPKKAKEYRIIDNKCSEYANWNEKLDLELKDFYNLELKDYFFPEYNYDLEKPIITESIIDWKKYKLEIMCPHCFYEFFINLNEVFND